ncbi:SDR family oxidoreductase [Alphaproteobacteria bacterium]|nr:SDR family oxidoreductase [Alphaproteobacteria bacterium]
MSLDFTDKVVIVTGAGGGLGKSHALDFARRGAKVVVNDLGGSVDRSEGTSTAAQAVVDEIIAAGGEAIANGSSVTDDQGVANMVSQTMEAYGRIDVLVNNAGVLRDKSFAKMTIDDFSFVVDVHLFGTLKPTKAVWPIMKEQGYGRIMVTSSSSGLYGNFGQANYGAAKMGVVGFINTLKLEGQKDNIHINALAPVAWTRMTSNLMPPEMEEMLKPEQVTPAVVFMCSENAPTGKIICAGAGAFASTHIVETRGMYLGADPSAEQVAENWEQISKLDDQAEALFQGGEQTRRFFELIQAASK